MTALLEVWVVDLAEDGRRLSELAFARGVLSSVDRQRHAAYLKREDAQDFAASRAALDLILETVGAAPGTRLTLTRSGKPFVPGLPGFSLSRTRGYAGVAVVSEGSVGIDIEAQRPITLDQPLVQFVSKALRARDGAVGEPLAAWTAIEAWCKLRGFTLAAVLDSPALSRELERAVESSATGSAALTLPVGITGLCWYDAPQAELYQRTLVLP